VLVHSSNYSYIDDNRNKQLDDDENLSRYPVATVEGLGAGEVVVIGDPSIFINAMLVKPDNQAFTRNLVRGHETVLLDFSHISGVPPLIAAQLALQRSPLLQIVCGLPLVFVVAYWQRIVSIFDGVLDQFRDRRPATSGPDQEVAERLVAEQFPEWDEERVRSITEEIMGEHQQEGTDGRNRR
jgi:hypothetical protein